MNGGLKNEHEKKSVIVVGKREKLHKLLHTCMQAKCAKIHIYYS